MNLLLSPMLANVYLIGGSSAGFLLLIVIVVLLVRR